MSYYYGSVCGPVFWVKTALSGIASESQLNGVTHHNARGSRRLSPQCMPKHPSDSAYCTDWWIVFSSRGTICDCYPAVVGSCRLLPVPSPNRLWKRRSTIPLSASTQLGEVCSFPVAFWCRFFTGRGCCPFVSQGAFILLPFPISKWLLSYIGCGKKVALFKRFF